jgi:hypothetical protein
VSGWADGAVRCSDAVSGVELWSIASAHRGAVTAVAVYTDAALAYLVTGKLLVTARDGAPASRAPLRNYMQLRTTSAALCMNAFLGSYCSSHS